MQIAVASPCVWPAAPRLRHRDPVPSRKLQYLRLEMVTLAGEVVPGEMIIHIYLLPCQSRMFLGQQHP